MQERCVVEIQVNLFGPQQRQKHRKLQTIPVLLFLRTRTAHLIPAPELEFFKRPILLPLPLPS